MSPDQPLEHQHHDGNQYGAEWNPHPTAWHGQNRLREVRAEIADVLTLRRCPWRVRREPLACLPWREVRLAEESRRSITPHDESLANDVDGPRGRTHEQRQLQDRKSGVQGKR